MHSLPGVELYINSGGWGGGGGGSMHLSRKQVFLSSRREVGEVTQLFETVEDHPDEGRFISKSFGGQ